MVRIFTAFIVFLLGWYETENKRFTGFPLEQTGLNETNWSYSIRQEKTRLPDRSRLPPMLFFNFVHDINRIGGLRSGFGGEVSEVIHDSGPTLAP
jgi:hypothetical protein